MIKRRRNIIGLLIVILSLVTAEVMLPVHTGVEFGAREVRAQSRKRSKKKRTTTRRRSSRRTSSRRRSRSRTVKARVGQQIPADRVLEIQRALVDRGFLKETTGAYDNATIEAMKTFQRTEEFRVTGYPTARALKELGLSLGPTPPTETKAAVTLETDSPQK